MFLASKVEERRQEIIGLMEGGKPVLHRNGKFEEQAKNGCYQVWNTQHHKLHIALHSFGFSSKENNR